MTRADPSLWFLLLWLVTSWLWGWLLLPASRRIFSNLSDGGLAAGRVLGLVLATLAAFWTASLYVLSLRLAPLLLLALIAMALQPLWRDDAKREEFFDWLRGHRRALVFSDAVFLFTFLFFAVLRARHPSLNEFEKPMDVALLASAWRATFLPFDNPWMAGVPFTNYYYFGPLMAALVARALGTSPPFAYNLAIALFAALFLSTLWSFCAAWTRSHWRGLAAIAMVALCGHFEPLRQMAQNGNWTLDPRALDWWKTSRVLPDTINEYPLFTLALGDLHAHFYAFSLAALFLCLCRVLFPTTQSTLSLAPEPPETKIKKKSRRVKETQHEAAQSPLSPDVTQSTLSLSSAPRRVVLILLGLVLGAWIMTNTWDVPLFALLASACAWFSSRGESKASDETATHKVLWALPPALAPLVALPYLLRFKSQVSGVAHELWLPDLASFAFLWSALIVLWACAGAAHAWRKTSESDADRTLFRALSILGFAALFAPMLFYIRGYFGDGDLRHQDTVFKFGLQAWLLLGTASACGALSLLRDAPTTSRRIGQFALASFSIIPIVCALCVWWSRGVRDAERDASGNTILSLDGARHLPPDDRIALDWLSQNARPGDVVLEAKPPGMGLGSYSAFARVSALSGVPAPLGWSQHVWFWGADPNVDIPPRQLDIDTVFNWRDEVTARDALERMKVKYIFVGQLERETYDAAGLAKLRAQLNVVQESGETWIGEVAKK